MINVKRVVLCLLFRPYGCILHPRFIIRRQSQTGFFIAKEEVVSIVYSSIVRVFEIPEESIPAEFFLQNSFNVNCGYFHLILL